MCRRECIKKECIEIVCSLCTCSKIYRRQENISFFFPVLFAFFLSPFPPNPLSAGIFTVFGQISMYSSYQRLSTALKRLKNASGEDIYVSPKILLLSHFFLLNEFIFACVKTKFNGFLLMCLNHKQGFIV